MRSSKRALPSAWCLFLMVYDGPIERSSHQLRERANLLGSRHSDLACEKWLLCYLEKKWLQATNNNNYVSARNDQTNTPLQATATQVQAWEQFSWVLQNNGTIALQSAANSNYVSARTDQTNTPLDATETQVQGWEQFRWGQVS